MRCHRPTTLAAVVAAAALSLLAAGCGGGGSPGVASVSSSTAPSVTGSSAASPANAMLLAGRCLREHGLANLPDPSIATSGPAKGQAILDKQSVHAFSDTVVTNAMAACSTELQKAGISYGSDAARTPQEIQDGLAFSRCVRRHGISNFPDPNGQGQFDLTGTGINEHSLTPAQLTVAHACLSVAHGAVHIPQQGPNAGSGG
jgi:hypothetical protein